MVLELDTSQRSQWLLMGCSLAGFLQFRESENVNCCSLSDSGSTFAGASKSNETEATPTSLQDPHKHLTACVFSVNCLLAPSLGSVSEDKANVLCVFLSVAATFLCSSCRP